MVRPIRPDEVVSAKREAIPDEVIEIFNELIGRNWNGYVSVVQQNEVVARLCDKLGISREEVFERHLLDVESLYKNEGWKVDYDSPAYNETYPATFKFTKKK